MSRLDIQRLSEVLGPLASNATGNDWFDAAELSRLLDAVGQHGKRGIRIRPSQSLDSLAFETDPVPWSNVGRFMRDGNLRPGSLLQFMAGDYAIQDAASLLPISLMQLQPGQRVLDCCAAPGGKSAAILEQLAGQGGLVSNEVIASRVDTLQLTLARTGYANYVITHQSVDHLAESLSDHDEELFDCVLVDAPCTGQSLVARGKQSLSAFSEHQIAHSAARQQSILRAAVRLVRPGGRLVYSTCTFAYEENEAIIQWLMQEFSSWQPVELASLEPWKVPGYPGCYRVWPHRDHCAGGFAAALVLNEPPHGSSMNELLPAFDSSSARKCKSHRHANHPWTEFDFATISSEWGEFAAKVGQTMRRQNRVSWFDDLFTSRAQAAAYCGIELAEQFGEHWQPAYALATLNDPTWLAGATRTELTDQEACSYMSGTSVHRTGPAGWQIVHWRGRPLGWAKQVGGQLKNHLPKPLRQPNCRVS